MLGHPADVGRLKWSILRAIVDEIFSFAKEHAKNKCVIGLRYMRCVCISYRRQKSTKPKIGTGRLKLNIKAVGTLGSEQRIYFEEMD
jgi:hypothetical protein